MSMPDENDDQSKLKEQWQQADAKRRDRHFQVRLDKDSAAQLQHYADQRHQGIINAALQTIISKFFNAK
jgi:hypothetical protein